MYSPYYLLFVEHFNRGEYRACVEPLEELWFVQRDDFHKALIRLVVGLNQIKLGLESGPRFLLTTASDLLLPYAPHHGGIDIVALRDFMAQQEALIGADQPEQRIQPFVIQLDPPPIDNKDSYIPSTEEL
jgi:hypothetical protein